VSTMKWYHREESSTGLHKSMGECERVYVSVCVKRENVFIVKSEVNV
jgi:hypothetical protein